MSSGTELETLSLSPDELSAIAGKHVLVVEDEFFLSFMIEADLESLGCSIVGPFKSVSTALNAAVQQRFDLAILDINLGGELVYPLAEELLRRGIPFLFLTGYADADMPEHFRAAVRLSKPHSLAMLARGLLLLLKKGASR